MIIPQDDILTHLENRQRSARTDPAMRDGDSSHGNPYETEPTTFGEIGSDRDIGDAVTFLNAEADLVPTADHTATGAERAISIDEVEVDDDDPTVLAEEATGGWNHAAAAVADHEDRSDENNRTLRAQPIRADKPRQNGRRVGRKDDDIPVRRDDELPIEGYRQLTVPEIIQRVLEMSIRQAREVQRYEGTHRRRKTLLVKLERYLRDKRDEPVPVAQQ